MKKNYIYTFVLFVMFLGFSCKEKPRQVPINLKFGHRGSGANVYNNEFIENTKPSILYALNKLDGCEIDIQMSKSGTIWVYHDNNLNHFCDTNLQEVCIPKSEDSFIIQTLQCREGIGDRVYKLEEVFLLFRENSFKEKFLSLDIKGYFDSTCFENRNAPKEYFTQMAKKLIELAKSYHVVNNLIVETPYQEFLDEVKAQSPKIRCHILGDDNFDEKMKLALEKKYDGISYSMFAPDLEKTKIKTARKNGLEVQLWPINNKEMLLKAMKLEPFAIQLSKVNF